MDDDARYVKSKPCSLAANVRYVGAIHGRMLLASTAAALAG